ncbi:AAA family ATPase [Burkholderia contaminans]|uniref:AAA family ATPase n=1 Tax=Burkholderia contaminans TaxID=488447 RepID=UPI002416691E|nr:AAA family ATPase [Burkholderia contaminans]WFN09430.1 AAA family ATPase [Burkholderia contaminans]
MILLELQLNNFRQFYGLSPVIKFATGPGSVNVLYGSNGAGKTAILNSFTWAMYDSVSKGFLFEDQIINKRAVREAEPGATLEASVQIKFEHLGRIHVLKKTVEAIKGAGTELIAKGEPQTTLMWADVDGKWKSETNTADVIGRVLPRDLHTYFFFDGERIERIVQPSSDEQADIANATKKLLGLEVIERAVRHLGAAKKTLERELEQVGDAATREILHRKANIEASLAKTDERSNQAERNLAGQRERARELKARLSKLDKVKADQLRRDQLELDRDRATERLASAKQQQNELLSAQGYKAFLGGASQSFLDLIEGLREKGELPAGIKRQFVDDLLEKNLCICARPLDSTSAHTARCAVESWKAKAGLAQVEEKAIRMGGEVRRIKIDQDAFWEQSDALQRRVSADREELSRVQTELEDIHLRLKHSPQEGVKELEAQLVLAGEAIEQANQDIGSAKYERRGLELELEQCLADLRKSQQSQAKQQLAKRRLEATLDAITRLGESRTLYEARFRRTLTEKVRSLFAKISYTPYVPEITENYSLHLLESAGGSALPVAASQGENQILSLAFIGAVIDVARDFTKSKEKLPGPETSTYPIVMDSPFGSLGSAYRTQVAEKITALADQVVLMVTPTQWSGEVETALSGRVGKRYLLEYCTTKDDIPPERIEIDGHAHNLVVKSPNDFEYTIIREVQHD